MRSSRDCSGSSSSNRTASSCCGFSASGRGEWIHGNRAEVQTHLVSEKEGRLPVDYRMAALSERWAVVDVVVDGVSLAANYRAQFTKIICTSSYETLLRRMRKHAE